MLIKNIVCRGEYCCWEINKKSKSQRNWILSMLLVYTIMSLMVVKVASTAALYQNQKQFPNHTEVEDSGTTTSIPESDNMSSTSSSAQEAERHNIEKMRAKLQQLQHEQQQLYRQQQQQMQQQHLQQLQMHANSASENAYLLERADDTAREQPIYGTWRTKARRPQPPAPAAAPAPVGVEHATSTAALNTLGDETTVAKPADYQQQQRHFYERLPKRAATMTPIRGGPSEQLPRPPRMLSVSQRPASSALVRRQHSESAGSLALRDDFKPKPFHFPYDGPLPEQFKKGHPEVNNIQDILQHLHLGVVPSKLPQMVMMPTGVHIAGSFKNLKSSGIGNFFRGKRQKKQMQLNLPLSLPMHMAMSMPMPMPMPMSMPMPMPMHYGALQQSGLYFNGGMPQPLQRVAIEQLYQYKPRSPQDINLLAIQQQQQHQSSSGKSKKKKKKHQQEASSNSPSLTLEHGNNQNFIADPYHMQNLPTILALNATRQPQLKRVPFKLNLDIYPVLPPTKHHAPSFVPSRPASVLRNPFHTDYMSSPLVASAAALTASTPVYNHQHHHGFYQTPFKFPTQVPPSHMPISFPDQITHYTQQQPHYHHTQNQLPDDCIYGQPNTASSQQAPDSHANQIMLHLNVFPKQKPVATVRTSTNPFYSSNSVPSTHRQTINELPESSSPIEPRHLPPAPIAEQQHNNHSSSYQNQTQLTVGNRSENVQQPNRSISRSDNFDALPLIDFEHPIVAAELPEPHQLPQASALTGLRGEQLSYLKSQGDHYRYHSNAHLDQVAAEAQTASLFRFPVEDLIQFQVDDAL